MTFAGTFDLISPASLLQLLGQEYHTVELVAQRGRETARVILDAGTVLAAQCGDYTDAAAVYHWLTWDSGTFALHTPGDDDLPADAIGTWEALLLEGARQRDEYDRTALPLPPAPPQGALQAVLSACPAIAGLALFGTDGRLLAHHNLPADLPVVTFGLALLRALHTTTAPPALAQFACQGGMYVIADWGTGVIGLATPHDAGQLAAVTAGLQQHPVAYPENLKLA